MGGFRGHLGRRQKENFNKMLVSEGHAVKYLGGKNNLQFKAYLSQEVPLEKLHRFLEENYLTVLYTQEYLEWFFSGEGSLCTKEDDEGNL